MLKRYGKNAKGKVVKQADVYLLDEHKIRCDLMDNDALLVCERLRRAGYEAYIVGGAVRDLLLGIPPKDFDIVTNADPRQARRACGRARIIGRRFPLVHAIAGGDKIFEVATFRALEPDEKGNVFGSMFEDAFRRDFTLNALYYEPKTQRIIDFHGAYEHIAKRQIVPIIPPAKSFIEDPVRMLRGVKYAVTTESSIPFTLKDAIKKYARWLATCSKSRLVEELNKVIKHEQCFEILHSCWQYGLLAYWLPEFSRDLETLSSAQKKGFWHHLATMKAHLNYQESEDILGLLFDDYLNRKDVFHDGKMAVAIEVLKEGLSPLVFANAQIYEVIARLFVKRKLQKEKMPTIFPIKRKKRPFRKKPHHKSVDREKSVTS